MKKSQYRKVVKYQKTQKWQSLKNGSKPKKQKSLELKI